MGLPLRQELLSFVALCHLFLSPPPRPSPPQPPQAEGKFGGRGRGGWGRPNHQRCLCLLLSPQCSMALSVGGVLATELFDLWGERMAGPPRGHGWPGERARVPQFQMNLLICPIGSSILEVHLEEFHPWTSTASYLLLPHSHCCRWELHTGTFMTKKLSSQKGCYG